MKEYFPGIPRIPYEGTDSKNPLAFRHYQADRKIGGLSMKEQLRFSIAFWHSFCNMGMDPFGQPTAHRPWDEVQDPMKRAEARVRALFEMAEKLDIPFFCFHDRDIAPEGETLADSNRNLDTIVDLVERLMKDSPLRLLWGTANLFSHPRYMHGAASSPDVRVFASAAAQVKKALEVTTRLGGENYVFWGGREGYETLLNTDMKRELHQLATFFHLAIDYAKEIGFEGQFLFEPKPKEPTTHQYDFDSASVLAFLHEHGLRNDIKLNIETNHATLAGHTMQHELHFARIHGLLGSVDANQGNLLLGWDTDQFPSDIYNTTLVMYEILKNGGLRPGGLNFDAKVRRPSWQPSDLVYSHISGMDAFAKGLKTAHALHDSKELEELVEKRYAGYRSGLGLKVVGRKTNFRELEAFAHEHPVERPDSGQQEMIESILNRYVETVD